MIISSPSKNYPYPIHDQEIKQQQQPQRLTRVQEILSLFTRRISFSSSIHYFVSIPNLGWLGIFLDI